MLYMPIIEAIEQQILMHPVLAKIWCYRFSVPSSSVKTPFLCTPFSRVDRYTSHARPCIDDSVSNYCVGNYADMHMLDVPILICAGKHKAHDAHELLDVLQDAVVGQLRADRSLNNIVRRADVMDVKVDPYVEIADSNIGAEIILRIKCIDDNTPADAGYSIDELSGMTLEAMFCDDM